MFGWKRRRATAHTIEQIRSLLASYQAAYGVPSHFWRDEFVLGFIGFMITFHGNITSGYKLSAADQGYLLFDVFGALSNLNGQRVTEDYIELASNPMAHPDFKKGMDNASAIAIVSTGQIPDHALADYEAATRLAAAQGEASNPAAVLGMMVFLLFNKPLKARFGGTFTG